jgi:flagellar motor switch/type III secretory pathway protein FliN
VTADRLELEALPRVPAREARAMRELLPALVALPRSWQADLPALGTARVVLAGVRPSANEERMVFAVTSGAGPGRLSVDASFGARLVDAALGGRAALRAPRPLGPAERGVLAGLLGAGLEPLGVAIEIGSAQPRLGKVGGAAAITFTIETQAGDGVVALELGGPLPPVRVDGGRLRTRAAQLPIVARVELAVTHLPAAEVVGLAPGDAVVFDGVPSSGFGREAAWPGALVIGARQRGHAGHAAPIHVDGGGELTVVGGFRARREEIDMEPTGTTDVTTVLAAAPIEVVAELGRITLRGDEILGLAPGAVFSLPGGRGGVSLRVGGELYAEGEIVDVDGELGVRVLRVVAR